MILHPYQQDGIRSYGFHYWCPGCNKPHGVSIAGPNSRGAKWAWNGDVAKPTFSPSVLLDQSTPRCHCFIENGMIRFLGDCEHALAGQTVAIPEGPDWWQGDPLCTQIRHGAAE